MRARIQGLLPSTGNRLISTLDLALYEPGLTQRMRSKYGYGLIFHRFGLLKRLGSSADFF
jgi:hypothetical protein